MEIISLNTNESDFKCYDKEIIIRTKEYQPYYVLLNFLRTRKIKYTVEDNKFNIKLEGNLTVMVSEFKIMLRNTQIKDFDKHSAAWLRKDEYGCLDLQDLGYYFIVQFDKPLQPYEISRNFIKSEGKRLVQGLKVCGQDGLEHSNRSIFALYERNNSVIIDNSGIYIVYGIADYLMEAPSQELKTA